MSDNHSIPFSGIFYDQNGEKQNVSSLANGISSIEKTGSEGLVDTYVINYTNGSTQTYTITNGDTGLSAYQIWLNDGNEGTEEDFILSLKGPKGDAGVSPISSDSPLDGFIYGRRNRMWTIIPNNNNYNSIENRPIIRVEYLPDPENEPVKEDTLYQVGDRFYIYKIPNVYPENSVLPSPYPTGWNDMQVTDGEDVINIFYCNLSSLMKIPTPLSDVLYVKVKINGYEPLTIPLKYHTKDDMNIYQSDHDDIAVLLGNDRIFDTDNLLGSTQIGSSFFSFTHQEAISSFEVLSISRNLTDESGFVEKHFVTDDEKKQLANPLTGAFFVVHSLTKKRSYSDAYFGVNSSDHHGYTLKYLKDMAGDPIYDKSLMRTYMKKMTNSEYLPVFGEEIYFYENNGADDIHKLYKVQLQELTPGNGELLCFFELGTPAEVFGLPDKETTLTKDTTVGDGDKIYAVDNDGNQVMLSIDDLKTLLGIS